MIYISSPNVKIYNFGILDNIFCLNKRSKAHDAKFEDQELSVDHLLEIDAWREKHTRESVFNSNSSVAGRR